MTIIRRRIRHRKCTPYLTFEKGETLKGNQVECKKITLIKSQLQNQLSNDYFRDNTENNIKKAYSSNFREAHDDHNNNNDNNDNDDDNNDEGENKKNIDNYEIIERVTDYGIKFKSFKENTPFDNSTILIDKNKCRQYTYNEKSISKCTPKVQTKSNYPSINNLTSKPMENILSFIIDTSEKYRYNYKLNETISNFRSVNKKFDRTFIQWYINRLSEHDSVIKDISLLDDVELKNYVLQLELRLVKQNCENLRFCYFQNDSTCEIAIQKWAHSYQYIKSKTLKRFQLASQIDTSVILCRNMDLIEQNERNKIIKTDATILGYLNRNDEDIEYLCEKMIIENDKSLKLSNEISILKRVCKQFIKRGINLKDVVEIVRNQKLQFEKSQLDNLIRYAFILDSTTVLRNIDLIRSLRLLNPSLMEFMIINMPSCVKYLKQYLNSYLSNLSIRMDYRNIKYVNTEHVTLPMFKLACKRDIRMICYVPPFYRIHCKSIIKQSPSSLEKAAILKDIFNVIEVKKNVYSDNVSDACMYRLLDETPSLIYELYQPTSRMMIRVLKKYPIMFDTSEFLGLIKNSIYDMTSVCEFAIQLNVKNYYASPIRSVRMLRYVHIYFDKNIFKKLDLVNEQTGEILRYIRVSYLLRNGSIINDNIESKFITDYKANFSNDETFTKKELSLLKTMCFPNKK